MARGAPLTDRLTPAGAVVYENRGAIMAKLSWGKMISDEVTQKVAARDA
ncbi:MAG: hypothetical protein K0Q89_155 [Thermomicrobiales bacterium]|nr:hypothetical protein [Thermomicrobiales bacterium]